MEEEEEEEKEEEKEEEEEEEEEEQRDKGGSGAEGDEDLEGGVGEEKNGSGPEDTVNSCCTRTRVYAVASTLAFN